MINKTFEVVEAYIGNREIHAFENGRRILDIILNDYDVDGAVKVLEALGYQLLYRALLMTNYKEDIYRHV